jgi:hypothetical protein
MKKIYFAVMASVLAIDVVMGGSRLRAYAGSTWIPLSQLAGGWAGEVVGNYSFCLNKTYTAAQSCSITPPAQVLPLVANSTFQRTFDTKGNSCMESFYTFAYPPSPEAASTGENINVGVVTAYNPATGAGTLALTGYSAEPGVSCNGAKFVNTPKEPASGTTTLHFVVSQKGGRLDASILTATELPVNFVAQDVEHEFSVRQ